MANRSTRAHDAGWDAAERDLAAGHLVPDGLDRVARAQWIGARRPPRYATEPGAWTNGYDEALQRRDLAQLRAEHLASTEGIPLEDAISRVEAERARISRGRR